MKKLSPAMERGLGQAAIWNRIACRPYRGQLAQSTIDALVDRGLVEVTHDLVGGVTLTAQGLEVLNAAKAKAVKKKQKERFKRLTGEDAPSGLKDRARQVRSWGCPKDEEETTENA